MTLETRETRETEIESAVESGEMVRFIDINLIEPNPMQFRKHFTGIEELTASIKSKGVRIPLKVIKRGDGYRLVCGERRWRAGKQAGLKTLPCIIVSETEENTEETGLIENLHRKGLVLIDEAYAVKEFESRGYNGVGIMELTGFSQSKVSKLLKIADFLREVLAGGFATYNDFAGMEKVGIGTFYEAAHMEDLEEAVEILKLTAREGVSAYRASTGLKKKEAGSRENRESEETTPIIHDDSLERNPATSSQNPSTSSGANSLESVEDRRETGRMALEEAYRPNNSGIEASGRKKRREKPEMPPTKKMLKALSEIGANMKLAKKVCRDVGGNTSEEDRAGIKESLRIVKRELKGFPDMLTEVEARLC